MLANNWTKRRFSSVGLFVCHCIPQLRGQKRWLVSTMYVFYRLNEFVFFIIQGNNFKYAPLWHWELVVRPLFSNMAADCKFLMETPVREYCGVRGFKIEF